MNIQMNHPPSTHDDSRVATFNDLSEDIIRSIMEAVYHGAKGCYLSLSAPRPSTVFDQALKLSQISSATRAIALNAPTLWSLLWYHMHSDALAICMQRTKEADVHIEIQAHHKDEHTRLVPFLETIADCLPRWKTLHVPSFSSPYIEEVLAVGRGRVAPRLEEVSISIRGGIPPKQMPIFDWDTPSLSYIHCQGIFPAPTSYSMHIRNAEFAPLTRAQQCCLPSKDIPRFFAPLTSMRLPGKFKISPGTLSKFPRIPLSNLRELLIWMKHNDDATLLNHWSNFTVFQFQSLVSLTLHVMDNGDHGIVLQKLLPAMAEMTHLQSLILHYDKVLKLDTLLNKSLLPSLQSLSVIMATLDVERNIPGSLSAWSALPPIRDITFMTCQFIGDAHELETHESSLVLSLYTALHDGDADAWRNFNRMQVIRCGIKASVDNGQGQSAWKTTDMQYPLGESWPDKATVDSGVVGYQTTSSCDQATDSDSLGSAQNDA